ncbi:MAG: AmmeMemoRadiSam system radical SAM enzyme [Bacteroidales bacterium]
MDKRQFLRTSACALGSFLWEPGRAAGIPVTATGSGAAPWKWSKKALFQVETPKGIRCQICPNECTLKEGEWSDCHNRKVIDNVLYTLAYGNPCAVHVDPVEKKPMHHFLPGSRAFSIATAGCNLACLNCQNWTISQSSPEETKNYDLMPDAVVAQAKKYECTSIAYTYSEPITYYEYTYDTAVLAREAGLKNILVSAGYIHRDPLVKLCQVIDGANIDLKSMDDAIYLKLNAGKLQPVLDTLKTMLELGVWLEITNLVVPSWTDDLEMIGRMCRWLAGNGFRDTPLHFSRFHPQYKLQNLQPTPVGTLEKAREIARAEGLRYVYVGNVPGSGFSHTLCPDCGKPVISREGYTVDTGGLNLGSCRHCGQAIPGFWK